MRFATAEHGSEKTATEWQRNDLQRHSDEALRNGYG
nr:MAG TPA: hypothetical protein [Caudoviricetes sp.]